MPIDPSSVQMQINAAAQALENLSVKERSQHPYKEYGENYNKLLMLAKEAMPSIDARRWPPQVPIAQAGMGPTHANTTYVEILSYFREMAMILEEGIDYPNPFA